MPNIKSAKKRVLIAEVRNARNKANKSALKTAIKKFEAAAVEGNRTEAEGAYKVAVKSVDKAAAKGILHKNTAARKKSQLAKKVNAVAKRSLPARYPSLPHASRKESRTSYIWVIWMPVATGGMRKIMWNVCG